MKLLVFFDPHIDSQAPISRKDAFEDTCFNKLAEIKEISKKHGCGHILCSGDVFNRKGIRVQHRLIARAADFFRSLDTPFITISGNHDQVGGNPEAIMDQPLGVLSRAANFKILGKNEIIQLDEETFLTGVPYYSGIDLTPADYLVNRPDKAKVHIILSHGNLLPHKPIWEPYTLYSSLKDCKADYVFNGHIHDYFGVEKINNTSIINTGSLTRGSLTESNINRPVSVAVLDTKTGKLDIIALKSAEKANKVFDLAKKAELEKAEKEINKLGELIKAESENVELSGPESIRYLVRTMKALNEPTKSKIFELLDRAETFI